VLHRFTRLPDSDREVPVPTHDDGMAARQRQHVIEQRIGGFHVSALGCRCEMD